MIGVIGLNHKTAPLAIRENFTFGKEEINSLLDEFQREKKDCEMVILSTCNRTEIYFNFFITCSNANYEYVIDKLSSGKLDSSAKKEFFYKYSGRRAVTHLFKVAAGLDSMVLGENEILGQIKTAYKYSVDKKCTVHTFNRLFHKAFEVGKLVRTNTRINEGASSISYAAVELAAKKFDNLKNKKILLIGAGEIGTLALKSMLTRGKHSAFVCNRTFSRAESLAERYSAQALHFNEYKDYLSKCDIIITATASSDLLITKEMMEEASVKRKGEHVLLIDLSVPRDIDPKIKKIRGISLYNIDDLNSVVADNYKKRKEEIKKAQETIKEYVNEYMDWHSSQKLKPVIDSLISKFSELSACNLNYISKNLPREELAEVRKCLDKFNKKITDMIIRNMRVKSGNGRNSEYIEMVRSLFELDDTDNDKR